jgi:parvulin-like peptidyl-prolyl isomerase
VEKLRVTQPGVLLEPFQISDWWLVVRLERYSPATFSDEISDQMCKELFADWQKEQTLVCLKQLS